MPRFIPIRLSENDKAEYARLARNTKAKISRTQKKFGIDLTSQVSLPPLESFQTRKEFNRWKESVQSFTNRNNLNYQFQKNKFGVVASKKQINELKRLSKMAQRQAKAEIKRIEKLPYNTGMKNKWTLKEQIALLGENNATGITIPKTFNFEKVRGNWEFQRAIDRLNKKSNRNYYRDRSEIMKNNYAKLILESFNSEGTELANKIESMSGTDFYDMYLSNKKNMDIDYFYTDTPEELRGRVDVLQHHVDTYLSGVANTDLKNF